MNTGKTNRLLNRVVIVTGAGTRESQATDVIVGNGRATSILFARAGALIVLVDNNLEWVKRTQELIKSEPAHLSHGADRTLIVQADVTVPSDCEAVVEAAMKKWARVDVLVNNVGIEGAAGTAIDVDPEEWHKGMDVNVLSMVLMSKYAIPAMIKTSTKDISRGTGKAIVNISSVSGLIGGIHTLLYPTSKGAVINMTRAMAAHHGPAGIRVNTVAPGMVWTPMVMAQGLTQAAREQRKNMTPLKIEGYAWDVGNAVVFLSSDEARWITGAVLTVDGGRTAGPANRYDPAEPPKTHSKL